MSDLLSLGLSGLTAYRNALAAVGENVANADTPGYARRSVRLTTPRDGNLSDPIYRPEARFLGVSAASVTRAWDDFRAAEARHASSSAGRGQVREQWLTAVETALDDGPTGVGASITALFNSVDTLAAAPGDTLLRTRFLTALQDVAAAFRTTAGALQRVATGITSAAGLEVEKLNQSLVALNKVNGTLLGTVPGSTSRATLEDERDRLIDAIAADVDVVVTLSDRGTASLALVDMPGTAILTEANVGRFALTAAADGQLTIQVTMAGATAVFPPHTGRLAGYIEAAETTADRRAALELLAEEIPPLNGWSAEGLDLNGMPGPPLIEMAAGAASMRALVTDPALVPAASIDGRPNGNLLALAAIRANNPETERQWDVILSSHAQQLAAAKSEHRAAEAWRENSFAALDEVTGVDLDREAADLLRYQQAYGAAARIVQVGRETIDSILALF